MAKNETSLYSFEVLTYMELSFIFTYLLYCPSVTSGMECHWVMQAPWFYGCLFFII